jgi:hypothetical protein
MELGTKRGKNRQLNAKNEFAGRSRHEGVRRTVSSVGPNIARGVRSIQKDL